MLSVHRWGVVQETVLFLGLGGGRAGGPEEAAAALPVVVGGGRTELLLTLVHAGLEDLEGDREEEETNSNNGDGKAHLLQPTSQLKINRRSRKIRAIRTGRTTTQRRRDVATARLNSVSGQDSNRHHSTDAADIEDDSEAGEEADATKAAGEDTGQQAVQRSATGETLDGSHPDGDGFVVLS